jgi:hypothetical protein
MVYNFKAFLFYQIRTKKLRMGSRCLAKNVLIISVFHMLCAGQLLPKRCF